MPPDGPADLPVEVARYLTYVTRRLGAGFGDQLLGVYLTGSAALGAFDPRGSDLDVVGICTDTVPVAERRALVPTLRHDALPCPARGLELVVYPRAVARGGRPDPGFVLELNDGPGMAYSSAVHPAERPDGAGDFWYVIDRSILRAVGRPLQGPPAADLVAEPARADLIAALSVALDWHRDAVGQRRNAVLNACRTWRWIVDGVWTSKPDAGRWALGHADGAARSAATAALEQRPIEAVAATALLDEVRQGLRRAAAT